MEKSDIALRKRLQDALDELRGLICELCDSGWTHIHFQMLVEHHHYQTDYIHISKVEDWEEENG